MIAHNYCICLSFYFILSVNYVTMKPPKISPSYFSSHTFSESFIKLVNNLVTYNERGKPFSDNERRILTTPVQTYNDIESRDNALVKFNKKIDDIKCTCCLIVKTQLVDLTKILESLRGDGAQNKYTKWELKKLKEEAILMLLCFLRGKVKAGKWLWSYFFKILAIIEYESNKNFIRETPFEEDELQSGITNFVQYCKNEKYFPKNMSESDLVSNNPNIQLNIFDNLRLRANESCTDGEYWHALRNVNIDNLYLKPFWEEHDLLFGKITGSEVEWGPTIRRYADEVEKTKLYVENRQWISKTFGHLSYHKLVKQIITVRIYTFMWVMLVIFNKEMPKMSVARLKAVYKMTNRRIDFVSELMQFTDTFFLDVVSEFHWEMSKDSKNFDSVIARISARVKGILVELNGCNSNGSDWISVNINEEFSENMINTFLQEFGHHFNELEAKSFSYNFELALQFLVDGN